MTEYQWVNRSHPQTLLTATILLYVEGIVTLLNLGFYGGLGLLVCVAMVVGGFGVANDKRWGYGLAVVSVVVSLALVLVKYGAGAFSNLDTLIELLFQGALLALLLHPMSRNYQRIWFR